MTTPAQAPTSPRPTRPTLVTVGVAVTVVAAVVTGVVLRAWLIFHTPVNSDEAIVGLMAREATHGHFFAFYWGQSYGGTAETDITALFFLVFGSTALAAKLAVTTLSGVAAVLVWRITRRLVPSPGVALMTGALVWAAPFATVSLSVLFYGFRGATLACGLGTLLVALRILDGSRRTTDFVLLGLLTGVGWWSSPEIVYYLIPSGLMVIGAVVISAGPRGTVWIPRALLSLAAGAVGSLPWWWANATSGFASLNTSQFASGHRTVSFGGHLSNFFRLAFPTELGLRTPNALAWVVGAWGSTATGAVHAAATAAVIAAVVLCLTRPGRSMAIGAGVLCFPFVYALSPATSVFANGRYAVFLPPLLAMAVVTGAHVAVSRLAGRRPVVDLGPERVPRPAVPDRVTTRTTVVVAGVVALCLALTLAGFAQVTGTSDAFTSGWGNPDGPSLAVITSLEKAGVTTGYANYWVAYRLDFLSHSRLTITTIGFDTNRSTSILDTVLASKRPAWLFVPPATARPVGAGIQFAGFPLNVGPDQVPQSTFVATLNRLHIRYRVVHAGLVTAVIPGPAVTPRQARMPGVPGGPATGTAPGPTVRAAPAGPSAGTGG